MPTVDGNRAQHIEGGGCPSVHPNGRWMCFQRVGHAGQHSARVFSRRTGFEAVLWD